MVPISSKIAFAPLPFVRFEGPFSRVGAAEAKVTAPDATLAASSRMGDGTPTIVGSDVWAEAPASESDLIAGAAITVA